MLVWENVFGAWVGWNERDQALLRAMLPVQRRYARAARDGRVDAARRARAPDTRVVGSRWSDGETTLWALANRGEAYAGPRRRARASSCRPAGSPRSSARRVVMVAGGGDATFPAREAVRVRGAGRARRATVPDGFVEVAARGRVTTRVPRPRDRRYGEAPFVEEWKPLPPRLHAFAERRARRRRGAAVRDRASAR